MNETLAYFSSQGIISDPGRLASAFENLPASLPELVKIVQNTTIHVFWVERYGLKAAPERMPELQLRTVERRLAQTFILDPRPMIEPRLLEQKLLGNCRDHSVLLAALLRHKGVPARARCGFGAYFQDNLFIDHWVAEYWHASQQRWILVDAQLDSLQCEALQISFDPLDVPRDQFIVGGRAWQMCRSGEQDPDKFGIFDMKGLGFVRGNLVRDLAALNKVELLPWDCWGIILAESLADPADLAVLDSTASLTAGDVPDFDAVRRLYRSDPRFQVGDSVMSFVNGQMISATLA
jgi:hypothetical protein